MTCPICDKKSANCDCTELERALVEERDRWIAQWRAVSDEFQRLDAEVKNLRAALDEALDIIVTAGVNDEREDVARIRAMVKP